tara:strand:- start:31 stop:381 length:351 start_codon:yes stop_codon:yes gene_type:complete
MSNRFLESDLEDEHGNILISPGLKVRHIDSQYEYTVDSVVKNGEDIEVILRLPTEPRFEPSSSSELIQSRSSSSPNIMYEIDPNAVFYEPDSEEEDEGEGLISVTQSEFEKEYEVK